MSCPNACSEILEWFKSCHCLFSSVLLLLNRSIAPTAGVMDTMNGLVVLFFSHVVNDLFSDDIGVHIDQFFRV